MSRLAMTASRTGTARSSCPASRLSTVSRPGRVQRRGKPTLNHSGEGPDLATVLLHDARALGRSPAVLGEHLLVRGGTDGLLAGRGVGPDVRDPGPATVRACAASARCVAPAAAESIGLAADLSVEGYGRQAIGQPVSRWHSSTTRCRSSSPVAQMPGEFVED